jgi:uncharacterized membrane protein (DUF373 family)
MNTQKQSNNTKTISQFKNIKKQDTAQDKSISNEKSKYQTKKTKIKRLVDSPKLIILFLSLSVFSLSYFFTLTQIILNLLSFLIMLEIIRTIWDYLVKDNHIIKIRFIIDGAILFCIRELFVGLTMMKEEIITAVLITLLSLFTIGALVFYRHKIILHFNKDLEKS